MPQERGNQQVYDNPQYGTITTTISSDTTYSPRPSSYPSSANNLSKEIVFDMSVNQTDIYGGYYN